MRHNPSIAPPIWGIAHHMPGNDISLGKDHIDQIARDRIKRFLKVSSEGEIRLNTKYAPLWVKKIIYEIVGIKK